MVDGLFPWETIFFFNELWKKIWFFDSVIWGIFIQEFCHKTSPPSQSSIILWQPLPLGMLLQELHELVCITTFLNVLKMALIQFLVDLSLQLSLYVKRGWTENIWLADWLAVALLPPPILPTRNSVQRRELWWIRSSCFKLLKAGKSSSKFYFVQVYIHQADTGVLGHLRYCHNWFSSSLGYLIPNLKSGVTDTEYMQQPKREVVLDPDQSCVISTDGILLLNKPIWFWSVPQGKVTYCWWL